MYIKREYVQENKLLAICITDKNRILCETLEIGRDFFLA